MCTLVSKVVISKVILSIVIVSGITLEKKLLANAFCNKFLEYLTDFTYNINKCDITNNSLYFLMILRINDFTYKSKLRAYKWNIWRRSNIVYACK